MTRAGCRPLAGFRSRAVRHCRVWLLAWLSLGGPAPALGHALAPSLLEIRELAPGLAAVRWKQPSARPFGTRLVPVLPGACRERSEHRLATEGTGLVESWDLDCPAGLEGQRIGVEGIAESRADVLLRLAFGDGRSIRQVLTADRPAFVVPRRESIFEVAIGYGRLGIEHILTGFDHLLFVLGLVLLVRGGTRLLWTVTAFTAGHSITLALAALGWVHPPSRPIEAGIAFSIYLLAVELAAPRSRGSGFMAARSWLVAGVFGLLHGLGFAGALAEVGLPEGEIPLALASFNVGIEIGQLAFVGLVFIAWAGLRALPIRWPAWALGFPAYAMGTCAAFWFFQRLAA